MIRDALARNNPALGGAILQVMQQALPKRKCEVDDEESERAFCVKEKDEAAFEDDVVNQNRQEVQNAESSKDEQIARV